MNGNETIHTEPMTLYRGVALLPQQGLPYFRDIDAAAEYVFNEPFPPLCSAVARRYNADEAYRRYREMRGNGSDADLNDAIESHFRGERELSFFVSAAFTEEQAVFFAGNTLKNNPFGLIVRFTRNHDCETFEPFGARGRYSEALVAGRIEPAEIDKILVVGCKPPNQMLIDFLFKRHENGRVHKYRNPNHRQYAYLRDTLWSPDTLFTPPLPTET